MFRGTFIAWCYLFHDFVVFIKLLEKGISKSFMSVPSYSGGSTSVSICDIVFVIKWELLACIDGFLLLFEEKNCEENWTGWFKMADC